MTDFDAFEDEEEFVSKTQLKREMEALQDLGKKLLTLSKSQQDKVPMTDTLRDALVEATRIKQREATRRHLQYIGKVMRGEDHEAIAERIALFDSSSAAHNKLFHQLEQTRDRLCSSESNEAVKDYLSANPDIDMQHFRQLVRLAKKETELNQKTTQRKKLFRLLREVQDKKLGLID
ncbi:DUF615 domain-containing protein [Marinomonas agarivorans]|nr:DUF615 domain-containing protein [Marinomonas agarivorans]